MDYKKIYDDLISSRNKIDRNKSKDYYEKHHIKPRAWGGSDNDENLILLTAREHWIAHLLLMKFATGQNKYKASQAVVNMGRIISEDKRKTSKLYESARKGISKEISKRHTGNMVVRDQETKEIIGRVDLNHPKVLSGEWAHHMKGRKLTQERAAMCACKGEKNGKYSGITDNEIVEYGLELYKQMGMLPSLKFVRPYVKKKYNRNIPKHFSKFRFPDKSFMEILEEKTGEKFNPYRRGKEKHEFNNKFKSIIDAIN